MPALLERPRDFGGTLWQIQFEGHRGTLCYVNAVNFALSESANSER